MLEESPNDEQSMNYSDSEAKTYLSDYLDSLTSERGLQHVRSYGINDLREI